MKNRHFSARTLRIVLILLIVLIISGGIGLYFLFSSNLHSYALEVSKLSIDAQAGDTRIQRYIAIERELEKYEETQKRAAEVVSDREGYAYQDDVVQALSHFASRNNIELASISFDPGTKKSTAAGATKTKSNTMLVTVTPKTPLNYPGLMGFIHDIENSLARMQIANLTIANSDSGDTLTTSSIMLEVYVK